MNIEKIKELRERLTISLSQAKELLSENEDISICERIYHKSNVNNICRLANCDESIAEKFYTIAKFDIEKAIKKIHEQLVFLTAYPNEPIDKIGFILWEENESLDKYVTSRDRSLFIATRDFDIVLETFESFFPLKNPVTNEIQESFDYVSSNFLDNKTCRQIINKMARIKTSNNNEEQFLRDLIYWFQVRLRYADYLVIYGNL